MNKELTLVFSSYQSQHLLKKILAQFDNKYKIIIIENSLDFKIKNFLEKKFKSVEVIIPKKNLGLAKSYSLGIKKAKTKFVFLNNPDISINDKAVKDLILCAKKINNFGAIAPTFKNERVFKNYEINSNSIFKNTLLGRLFKNNNSILPDRIMVLPFSSSIHIDSDETQY